MRVTLRQEFDQFIESKVQSGMYVSADEVVENALARWKAQEEIDPAELKRLVAEGQGEANRGELIDAEDVFKEIRQKSVRRQGESV
jgi:putative addiction module CopG family antidote